MSSGLALSSAAAWLRELSHGQRARLSVVLRRADGRQLALVDAVGRRVHTMHSLEHLVAALASGDAELVEHNPQARGPGVRLNNESFVRLCWLVGARLGRDVGLAPWLNTTTNYRLLSWPDFGEIGEDPEATRLFAVIAKRELGIAAMVEIVQLPQRTVHQLVNSLSLCGLLASGPVSRRRTPGATRSVKGVPGEAKPAGWFGPGLRHLWRRLFRRLFRHLLRARGRR